MLRRIREACKAVAAATSSDFVTRAGDIQCDKGLPISNLTDTVIEHPANTETKDLRAAEQDQA